MAHVFTNLANDDDEFAFVVQLCGSRPIGNRNGRAGILQSVWAFGEYNGIVARTHANFVCVAAIVLSDAPNHGRNDGSENPGDVGWFLHDASFPEGVAFDPHVRASSLLGGMLNFS